MPEERRSGVEVDAGLEEEVQSRGRSLLADLRAAGTGALRRDGVTDRITRWAMADEALKVELFRFIDVLPVLGTAGEIRRHIQEYLLQPGLRLPPGMKGALRAGLSAGPLAGLVAWTAHVGANQMARRFIAGSNPAAAAGTLRRLRDRRMGYTLDILGEAVTSEAEARAYQARYLCLLVGLAETETKVSALPQVDQAPWGPLPRINVSLKPSSLYSRFDPLDAEGTAAAVKERLRPIFAEARRVGAHVHVDMEQYAYKDITLRICREILTEEDFRDWEDVGVVIQTYLRDAEADLVALRDWVAGRGAPIWVRLVKGAYWDYETVIAAQKGWPVPVFTRKWETDANFESLTRFLLANRDLLRPAIGSHNVRSVAHAMAAADHLNLPPGSVEYQVLYGMGDRLGLALASRGERVRVYVPYGDLLPGMAYLVRRLLENTSNESFLRHSFAAGVPDEELLTNPVIVGSAGTSMPARPAAAQPEGNGRRGAGPAVARSEAARAEQPTVAGGKAPVAGQTRTREVGWPGGFAAVGQVADGFPPPRRPQTIDHRPQTTDQGPGTRDQGPGTGGGGLPRAGTGTAGHRASHIAHRTSHIAHRTSPFHNEPETDFSREENRRAMGEALGRVRSQLGRHYPLVIDGREVETGTEAARVNPSRVSEVVGVVSLAGVAEAEAAVAAARVAFPAWRDTRASERSGLLFRTAAVLRRRRLEMAAWQVLEVGKTWREADADVAEAIDFLEYYGREMLRLDPPRRRDVPGERNEYFYEGRGVAAVIAPWNFPLAILTGMTSAALAAGNTVAMKPSGQSSVVAYHLMDAFREAGAPEGILHYLPGRGGEIGSALVEHPDVVLIAFTGSKEVGLGIHQAAAVVRPGQRDIKRVIAELGGKNAVIIDSDADLDEAVPGVLASAFGYQGQKCSACSRAIVLEGIYDAFVERLTQAARSVRIGPAEDPGTTVGPVIDASARNRIRRYLNIGRQEGRLLVEVDPGPLAEEGYFVPPTIFAEVDPQATIAQEEIFGPVLAVLRVKDFDEALCVADGTLYALTGGLYSRSPGNIARARREFRTGNLFINRKITGALVDRQPFGGFRLSGVGSKAGGPDYLQQFLVPRTVTEWTLRRGFAPEDTSRGGAGGE